MSYTNQTQHYGLPQYVGTDVPAWLTDVNGAFATIDQGMNAAKTQADSAATAAGQAANDIVAINSTLGTQAGQISAAAGAAATAQTTANSADGKADTNAQNISELDTRVAALESSSGGGHVIPADKTFSQVHAFSGQTDASYTIQETGLYHLNVSAGATPSSSPNVAYLAISSETSSAKDRICTAMTNLQSNSVDAIVPLEAGVTIYYHGPTATCSAAIFKI